MLIVRGMPGLVPSVFYEIGRNQRCVGIDFGASFDEAASLTCANGVGLPALF